MVQRDDVALRAGAAQSLVDKQRIGDFPAAVDFPDDVFDGHFDVIEKNGGPEELKLVDVQVGEPGPGEIRIRHKAIGLNFIDVYQRSGLYQLPMPLQLGMEASGVVEAVGEGVTHLKVGDRAAYASQPPGSYCEARVMPAMTVYWNVRYLESDPEA